MEVTENRNILLKQPTKVQFQQNQELNHFVIKVKVDQPGKVFKGNQYFTQLRNANKAIDDVRYNLKVNQYKKILDKYVDSNINHTNSLAGQNGFASKSLRKLFQKQNNIPGPGQYNNFDFVKQLQFKNLIREPPPEKSIIQENTKTPEKTIGPGSYTKKYPDSYVHSIKYKKDHFLKSNKKEFIGPDPGTYQKIEDFYENKTQSSFQPKNSQKFLRQSDTYQSQKYLDKQLQIHMNQYLKDQQQKKYRQPYSISQEKQNSYESSFFMDKSTRSQIKVAETPGPGNYFKKQYMKKNTQGQSSFMSKTIRDSKFDTNNSSQTSFYDKNSIVKIYHYNKNKKWV